MASLVESQTPLLLLDKDVGLVPERHPEENDKTYYARLGSLYGLSTCKVSEILKS